MSRLQLSAALVGNPLNQPILSGRVVPEGVDLLASAAHPSELFWRQLRYAEFDVSELSLASLMIQRARGEREWVALPVFTTRRFFHTEVLVRRAAGISSPSDLSGRRVAVPEYQQTAAVWARGALQHEFGVRPADMEWFMERGEQDSHGGATGFRSPPGVQLTRIPPETSIAGMLQAGDLDAAVHYVRGGKGIDRSNLDPSQIPGVERLFKDPVAEGIRYLRSTGLLPVNHCVVIRATLADKYPWLARNIYDAFLSAKQDAVDGLRPILDQHLRVGSMVTEPQGPREVFPYGFGDGNERVIETLASYLHEQGLTDRVLGIREVFAETTLDL